MKNTFKKGIPIFLLLQIVMVGSCISQEELKEGFKNFDASILEHYFSVELAKDHSQIQKQLNHFAKQFAQNTEHERVSKIEEAEREGYVGSIGTDLDSTLIKYFYLEREGSIILTEIQFGQGAQSIGFPESNFNISKTIEELESLNDTKEYYRKIELYDELIQLTKDNISNNVEFFKDPINTLSEFYGGKSWYSCLINRGEEAVQNANIGLSLDPSNEWIVTNLALGYLLAGNQKKARAVYLEYADEEIYPETLFREVFIDDLDLVQSLGLEIKGVKKIKSALKK